jgi:hypothetical protein
MRGGALATLVVLAVAALAAHAKPALAIEVGVADQEAGTFGDARYRALGLTTARLVVPWNAARRGTRAIDSWLEAARASGAQPLVSFGSDPDSRCPSSPCVAPSVDAYRTAFRAFRARFPWVSDFAPWNEANHRSQPTAEAPAQAAEYYNVVRAECPGCRVLAAEVVDSPNMETWLREFRSHASGDPRLWGLHNYADVNRFGIGGTERLLDTVPGAVWLSEVGGIVSYMTADGQVTFPYDEDRAALATHQLFWLARAHRDRIARVYIYDWKQWGPNRWDSALVGPDDLARPALGALREELAAERRRKPPPVLRRGRARLRLVDRQTRMTRAGRFGVRVRCTGFRVSACTGSLDIARGRLAAGRHLAEAGKRRIGRRSLRLVAGRIAVFRFSAERVRRIVRRTGAVHLTVFFESADSAGARSSAAGLALVRADRWTRYFRSVGPPWP